MSGPSATTSPPATPPPLDGVLDEDQWRFKETRTICEWAEAYRPGGLHPIHFGDTFKNGQYRVIRKLGDGAFSTVWLAIDKENLRYVALKVMMAKKTPAFDVELLIYGNLTQNATGDLSFEHILMPLDTFLITGPNGIHSCLVLEPMGSTTASMAEYLPNQKHIPFSSFYKYPKWMAKRILKHALSGLVLLHKNNIVHGDVQPGNLLFPASTLDLVPEEELQQTKENIAKLYRLDGKEDLWAPKYIIDSESLHRYANVGPDFIIKISDFGAAFWANDPPQKTVTPLALRAPELILSKEFDKGIDIWAIGCLIFEFVTGRSLFLVCYSQPEEQDDEHLLDMNDTLGPLPDTALTAWPRAHEYFQGTEDLRPTDYVKPGSIETKFDEDRPDDVDDEEARVITSLIRQILKYGPSERPSAAEILEHPWFKE